jgi:hypothetical protein
MTAVSTRRRLSRPNSAAAGEQVDHLPRPDLITSDPRAAEETPAIARGIVTAQMI